MLKWTSFNEALRLSDDLHGILYYLATKKNNKVAKILKIAQSGVYYKDDENINYISGSDIDNMISFLPLNRRSGSYDINKSYKATGRQESRVGRVVKSILDKMKPFLSFKGTKSCYVGKNYSGKSLVILTDLFLVNSSNYKIKGNVSFRYKDKDYIIPFDEWHMFPSESNNSFIIISNLDVDISLFRQISYGDRVSLLQDCKVDINFDVSVDLDYTQHDIEIFVNEYISYVKSLKSDDKIKIVSGEEIRNWYWNGNYKSDIGKLGSSCMSDKSCYERNYFYIYSNSDKISMAILTNEGKLVGRALIWELSDGSKFMDRIYTAYDNEDNIFVNYAIENNMIYRNTNNDNVIYLYDGKEISKPTLKFKLEAENGYYPYMDTMKFLESSTNTLYNIHIHGVTDYVLTSTEGEKFSIN